MDTETILDIVARETARLARDLDRRMRSAQPRSDFLETVRAARELGAEILTDWRAAFLASAAGRAARERLGEDGRLTVYIRSVERSGMLGTVVERLCLNGLSTGVSGRPRFVFGELRGGSLIRETPIDGRADLLEHLPEEYLFHVCRHLAGPEADCFIIEDLAA